MKMKHQAVFSSIFRKLVYLVHTMQGIAAMKTVDPKISCSGFARRKTFPISSRGFLIIPDADGKPLIRHLEMKEDPRATLISVEELRGLTLNLF